VWKGRDPALAPTKDPAHDNDQDPCDFESTRSILKTCVARAHLLVVVVGVHCNNFLFVSSLNCGNIMLSE
jgi:hypothetical protein